MAVKHYKEMMSAFLNQELGTDERQLVAEHLLVCGECRSEHDEIKLGSALMRAVPRADAPQSIWNAIEEKLDGRRTAGISLIPDPSFFSIRKGIAFATAVLVVSGLCVLVYLGLFSGERYVATDVQNTNQIEPKPAVDPQPITTANNNQNSNQANVNANVLNTNAMPETPQPILASWQVETLAGMPRIGEGDAASHLAVGQMLETDAKSKAKIKVADIGSVEIAPNSRVRLVGTSSNEHRLALERGQLHAKIFAPPRLFVVDTPSGKAVDLGCEYTLQVDRIGNSVLRVTGGFVALEDNGRESIVPAGMMCLTRKGKGLGTPFSAETNAEFRKALERFDFINGSSDAVQLLLAKADFDDMVTLWHLLSRVPKNDRGAVFDKLAGYVTPPAGVTREGIMNLDKKMLTAWRAEVESVWFN